MKVRQHLFLFPFFLSFFLSFSKIALDITMHGHNTRAVFITDCYLASYLNLSLFYNLVNNFKALNHMFQLEKVPDCNSLTNPGVT